MSARNDWDKLPDFVPLHQAVAEASTKISDRSFSLEYNADYSRPAVQLVKGEFTKDLYLDQLDKLIDIIAQHYNKGYINYRIATLKATRLTPVPADFADEIVRVANRELEWITKQKKEYAQL